jgi:N-acyl-L-homoserine lactone synthetase
VSAELSSRPYSANQAAAAALQAVDVAAARFLKTIAPIRFGVAESDEERLAAFRLRYQAVVEHGWLRADELPAGLERDAYDAAAVHIVGWDGAVPAATSRLIRPRTGTPLPTEEAFGMTIEPCGQVVDAGRFVVARAYSSLEHHLLMALLARSWLEVRALGYMRVCAAFASLAMLRVYRALGLKMTVLGPPHYYWGMERYPILFDTVASAPDLLARWQVDPKL